MYIYIYVFTYRVQNAVLSMEYFRGKPPKSKTKTFIGR